MNIPEKIRRFAKLERKRKADERNGTVTDIAILLEIVNLDKQIGENDPNWRRHYPNYEQNE